MSDFDVATITEPPAWSCKHHECYKVAHARLTPSPRQSPEAPPHSEARLGAGVWPAAGPRWALLTANTAMLQSEIERIAHKQPYLGHLRREMPALAPNALTVCNGTSATPFQSFCPPWQTSRCILGHSSSLTELPKKLLACSTALLEASPKISCAHAATGKSRCYFYPPQPYSLLAAHSPSRPVSCHFPSS